jgi:hypothetical protein
MKNLKLVVGSLRTLALATCLLFSPLTLRAVAGTLVSANAGDGAFSLTDCSIVHDKADYAVVGKTAELLAGDIETVTGKRPGVFENPGTENVVILGTLGHSALIDRLVSEGKLDVSDIKGGWERFVIRRLRDPLPGVRQALVVAGSDRRGTAYGAFTISEAMGVGAWSWWADVPVKKSSSLYVVGDYTSKSPSVKYRGIFINDEDWGIKPWASYNYEKALGDIGPGTYARVCELILRLKGNMLAPAMHSCTGAFYSHPESKHVADDYGIIVTTSHCEPLLFNNAAKSEWDIARDGEWNYAANKNVVLKKLDDRVREASPFENIYTVGMRGLHDEGMRGNYPKSEQVDILERVMADQRDILRKYLNKPAEEIPQIFVPYKETMQLYGMGLKVPDDVTLVWVDDNYGYIRRLGDPQERQRSGGAGVYYHNSYLGSPHDYLWLCTTPPVLMYEELKKAYDTGANRYWLLNVGDIKPTELGMQTFFELAWNVDAFDIASVNRHRSEFLAGIFGEQYRAAFQDILDTYYRLAWSRKPEYMGWEREWDTPLMEQVRDTQYSFENYNDARQRLADYSRIADLTDRIGRELPENYRPAFFELVAYPVQGSCLMNRKFLMAQLSNEEAKKGDLASANWAAKEAGLAFNAINKLTRDYNTLLGGKWNGMMAVPPGFCALYQNMPKVTYTDGSGVAPLDVAPRADQNKLEGCAVIDLRNIGNKVAPGGHTLRLVEGIGYDWVSLQLGDALEPATNPSDVNGTRVDYVFSGVNADSVTVYVYTVPTFPLCKGRSTRFGISVDKEKPFISENNPAEYSLPWRDRVLRNGDLTVARFAVKRTNGSHTLSLICGDPGIIVERVVIDWGGLKHSYVGPSASLAELPQKVVEEKLR